MHPGETFDGHVADLQLAEVVADKQDFTEGESRAFNHMAFDANVLLSRGFLARYAMPGLRSDTRHYWCDLVRDVFGNPFRPVNTVPAWLTSTVVELARGIYEERAFDRLPILADALQDAGCDSTDILDHCRGPGPHVRGCWVVDLVLGKA
jgi:hypothetical protein